MLSTEMESSAFVPPLRCDLCGKKRRRGFNHPDRRFRGQHWDRRL